MPEPLWTFDKLAWYARSEDPEIRYWAAERLIRVFPERAPGVTALLLLDEHEATPELVADNLRVHGTREHVPLLLRAFRQMRGTVPGRAFEALVRLGHPDVLKFAMAAVERNDLSDESLALIIGAVGRMGTDSGRSTAREMIARRADILSEPEAMRGALEACPADSLPDLFASFARALQWRGLGRSTDLLHLINDSVEADDCGWCLRTGPDGRIDLGKTIKAVESSYDCEVVGPPPALSPDLVRRLVPVFRSGDLSAAIGSLSEALQSNLEALRKDADDPLPGRIAGVARAAASASFREEAERLGPVFLQGVVTVLLSCLFKVARYRNYALEVNRAGTDTEALLALAGIETAFLLERLPRALAGSIAAAGEEQGHERRERILEWCRRMLEARGPFFPKAMALETIGELKAEDHVPELLDGLTDDNSYIFGAAERALGRLGPAIIGPVRARLEAGRLDHESIHSLLVLLVELGDRGSLSLLLDHFDDLVERVGAAETAEWAALMGARELFEPLHRILPRDLPRVGQALLLIGAIHNIPVPEEPQIQQAIEEYWRRHPAPSDSSADEDEGPGSYVM